MEALRIAGKEKRVEIKIAQSPESKLNPGSDTRELARDAGAEVNVHARRQITQT